MKMRARTWLGIGLMVLGFAAPAWAQRASNFTGSFSPRRVVNQPIDTTRLVTPVPFQQPPSRFFNLRRLFPKFLFAGSKPLQASPPPPAATPAAATANPFQPLPPFMPR